MSTKLYDTDLSDAAWALVAPVLPAARPGGRPRTTDVRAVVNAIFYLLRTGCQWRLLPREFPRWGTVYHYFRVWKNSGVWTRLHRAVYEQARLLAGRARCPSVVIMDGQSVKTTERGGVRGFDGHKRVRGRKRHILVDILGLPIASRVEPASISDRRAGARLLGGLRAFFPANPDRDCRCRARKPRVGSNAKAARGLGAADRQAATARFQDHRADVDRGTQLCVARPKPPVEPFLYMLQTPHCFCG